MLIDCEDQVKEGDGWENHKVSQSVRAKIQSKFQSEHTTARIQLEELGVRRREVLKSILKKHGVKVGPEFKWPRLVSSGWLLRIW